MKIKILYEDLNILAIEKPSGVLVDEISKKYPKFILAHRLDKETSGVMLLAKNEKVHDFLKAQFSAPALGLKTKRGLADRQSRIKKTYVAIVNGSVKNDHGIINKPIGRSPSDFRRRLAGRGARGELRESITEYKVLKRLKNFTYLEIKPKTGRTHQIRVHLKFLNHPIVGDSLYNPGGSIPLPSLPLAKGEEKARLPDGQGWGRMMLHAKSIEFENLQGKIIKVESKIPKEFLKMVK